MPSPRGAIAGAAIARDATTYSRRLSTFDAAMVTVGGIIGGGIFINPAVVAQRVHTAGLILAVWGVGGAIAIAGALTFAELGGRRPRAGGGYVYLREAFGSLPAFLYGWTFLVIINTGGMAAVAVTFARYTVDLAGIPLDAIRPIAVAAILLLTGVNYFGIRAGATTQNIFTLLKLAALAAVIAAGIAIVFRAGAFGPALGGAPAAAAAPAGADLIGIIGVALIPVLFTYGGWAHTNNIAGEVRDAARTLPRAMLLGILIVVTVYLAANIAYVAALGPTALAASTAPASDTLRRAVGSIGGTIIGVGIAASTFGFVNLTILSAPRILQAMAADGLFFARAARLHPRYRTPTVALLAQAVWAVVLTWSGTYDKLLDYVVFGDWIFFGLIAATIFVYRARDRALTRIVFRVPGYPIVPAAFIAVAVFVVTSSVRSNPRNALLGFCLIFLGIPVYGCWRALRALRPATAGDDVGPGSAQQIDGNGPSPSQSVTAPPAVRGAAMRAPAIPAPAVLPPAIPAPAAPPPPARPVAIPASAVPAPTVRPPAMPAPAVQAPVVSGPVVLAPFVPPLGVRKESPYITWVKQLPSGGINLAGSAVPACPPWLLGPAESDAPLNERSDYGWPPLVTQLATRYAVPEESIVVATGTSMANHLAIATLLERGDHVLVEHPGYDPLIHVPALWGATVTRFARRADTGYRLDVDAVRAALTPGTRLVVLSDLHNPTGAGIDASDLAALAALADERGFYILVDEVYGEWLREDGLPSTVHASPRVIATSSLTKVWGLGGLRVGWILAEPALAERMRRFAALFDNVIAHPSERLAVRAIARSATIIRQHAPLLAHNRQLLRRWVATTSDGRWVQPAAGAIAFVDLGIGDVWEFVERLAREHETLIVPGHFFGAPDHVRIGLGMDAPVLEQGLAWVTEQMKGHKRQDPRHSH